MKTSLNENSTFFERILHLSESQGYKNITDFAKNALGYTSPQKILRLKDESNKPSVDILMDISNKFENVDVNWLFSGKGHMYKDYKALVNAGINSISEPSELYQKKGDAVAINRGVLYAPLVGQYAYAGYLSGYADPVYVEGLPTIPFLIPEGITAKGSYRAFEVRGDSYDDGSSDSVLEGDVVLGRKIGPDLYRDSKLHISKWLFVIVHKEEGILLKRIKEHKVEQRYLVLQSLNPMYEDRMIHLADVAEVYNVVQLLRKPKA